EEPALAGCRLRRVSCGGEAMPSALPPRFFARLDAELHNFYGPTETAVDATFRACRGADGQAGRPVPIGRPVGSARVYVLDRAGRLLPAGVPGELCVGGAAVSRGYLDRPDATAERFVPDPFAGAGGEGGDSGGRLYRTGDLARFLPNGSLEFL